MTTALVAVVAAAAIVAVLAVAWAVVGRRRRRPRDTDHSDAAAPATAPVAVPEPIPQAPPQPPPPTEFRLTGPDGRDLFAQLIDPSDSMFARADAPPSSSISLVAIDKALDALPPIAL